MTNVKHSNPFNQAMFEQRMKDNGYKWRCWNGESWNYFRQEKKPRGRSFMIIEEL